MRNTFTIGHVRGIEIGIHYTWLFAFALVTWSLASGYFPGEYRGWSAGVYWLLGGVAALMLFSSVLVHELSHSFMALARGQEVHSITLFIFGGVSNLKAESEAPRDEFLISVVGPLTSFLLAGLFWVGQQLVPGTRSPLDALLSYLTMINLMLGVFNLLPGFPLDGGRVLRSIVWAASGSLRRGTEVASWIGQAFGFVMIVLGVSQLFAGNLFGGLWIAFIGWFLNGAAESIRSQQATQESLGDVRVADVMNAHPPVAPAELSVEEFVFEYVLRQGQRAVLIVEDDSLIGLLTISDVKKLPQEQWRGTRVHAIMTPLPLKTLSPTAELRQALQLLAEQELNQAPVVHGGRLVGLLSRSDVMRYLQLRDALGIRGLPARAHGRPAVA
jgi:Zn-dependent protease/CBS domain-containing protein